MSGDQSDRAIGRAPAMPAPGSVIANKYQVERVLGAGGMGVVLAAKHLQLGQRVAIKFMRDEAALDTQAVSRFLREAQAAAALSSEHVTRVLDVGTLDSGQPFMVMEFLAGVDLGAVVHRDGPLPVREAVGTVLQACEGIAEAHAIGIVHRDLKPANLFVTRRVDGSSLVKVLDFGISKLTELSSAGGQDLTASGSIMGSPGYMSPEQVRNAKATDARSDIWSLGVILYEILTSKNPFVGETIGETFARIVSDDPPPIQSLRPEIPAGLADVVRRCLERSVATRISSVESLAAKLLPFGPEDARISVERIRRITASLRGSGDPQGTMMPPDTMSASASGQPTGSAAWLRSGTSSTVARGAPWRKWAAIGIGPAVAVPVLVFAIGFTRHPERPGDLGFPSSVGAAAASGPGATGVAPGAPPAAATPASPLSGGPGASKGAQTMPAETLAPPHEAPDLSGPVSPGLRPEGAGERPGTRHAAEEVHPQAIAGPARQAVRVPRASVDAGPSPRAQPPADLPPKKSPYDDL